MEDLKLYDSEYRFMNLIWELQPVRSTELSKQALKQLGWKKSTCFTVLKKLAERGFIRNEAAVVTTLVEKEQVLRYESEALLNKTFDGSLPAFLTAFLKDRRLTGAEAEELKKMIEEAAK